MSETQQPEQLYYHISLASAYTDLLEDIGQEPILGLVDKYKPHIGSYQNLDVTKTEYQELHDSYTTLAKHLSALMNAYEEAEWDYVKSIEELEHKLDQVTDKLNDANSELYDKENELSKAKEYAEEQEGKISELEESIWHLEQLNQELEAKLNEAK